MLLPTCSNSGLRLYIESVVAMKRGEAFCVAAAFCDDHRMYRQPRARDILPVVVSAAVRPTAERALTKSMRVLLSDRDFSSRNRRRRAAGATAVAGTHEARSQRDDRDAAIVP